jgi:hypothetical protein
MSCNENNARRVYWSGLLLVETVLVVLHLTHVIDWPWVWVFAPLWISVILGYTFTLASTALLYIADRQEKRQRRKQEEHR